MFGNLFVCKIIESIKQIFSGLLGTKVSSVFETPDICKPSPCSEKRLENETAFFQEISQQIYGGKEMTNAASSDFLTIAMVPMEVDSTQYTKEQ